TSTASRLTFRDDSAYAPHAEAGRVENASDLGSRSSRFPKNRRRAAASHWHDGQFAHDTEARQEQDRQQSLEHTDAGTRERLEQAVAAYAKAEADVRASRAVIAAQRHQLDVLQGTKKQRAADLGGAKAALRAA